MVNLKPILESPMVPPSSASSKSWSTNPSPEMLATVSMMPGANFAQWAHGGKLIEFSVLLGHIIHPPFPGGNQLKAFSYIGSSTTATTRVTSSEIMDRIC